MQSRILVTGASGFVGRPLMTALLDAGYTVRIATRRPLSFPGPIETVIIPDLTKLIDWAPIVQGVDIIIHAAGLAHMRVTHNDYLDLMRINIRSTRLLAEAAKQAGVKRFVYISSVRAQIGPFASHVVREDDELQSTNLYGRSKLAAENALRNMGPPFTIFRPVVIYGPGAKGNIKTLIRIAKLRLPIPIVGAMSRRSMLGIDNFISAILFALNTPATINETYLLADSAPMSVSEILAALREGAGGSWMSVQVPQIVVHYLGYLLGRSELWMRIVGDLVVDTNKIEALGWHPPKDTIRGLRDMLKVE